MVTKSQKSTKDKPMPKPFINNASTLEELPLLPTSDPAAAKAAAAAAVQPRFANIGVIIKGRRGEGSEQNTCLT